MAGDHRHRSDEGDRARSGRDPREVRPRAGAEVPAHPLLRLQRFAGNDATRLLIQRLEADDAQEIEDIAGYMANPFVYGAGKLLGNWPAAEKYGEWAAGKYEKWGAEGSSPLGGLEPEAPEGAEEPSPEGEDGGVIHEDMTVPGMPPPWWDTNIPEAEFEEATEPLGGPVSHGGGPAGQGPGGEAEATGGDPLAGLRPGDGLDVGTWRRRPRVKLLQHRLNEAGGASLKVDGMWGSRTSAALEAFQLSHDMLPTPSVDAATAAALRSERAPGGPAEAGAGAGPVGEVSSAGIGGVALPDVSGLVAPDILARWQNPLAAPPGTTLAGGPERGEAAGLVGGGPASGLAGNEGGEPAGAETGAEATEGYVIKTDPATLARFEYYKPVLYDMYERYNRAAQDTQAYFALLQQSAAVAAYYGSRAFSSICASLAGIVLGPPGVILWNLANEFWGLGARMAAEAEKPILEAATVPALDALIAFGNVVQESFNEAYPMRDPDMPWYVVGAGAIAPPTSTLLHAYQRVGSLAPR